MKQSEIITLRNQLEQVRREKHAVEEDRAANAKQRDKEVFKKAGKSGEINNQRECNELFNPSNLLQIERLVLENGQLKQCKIELEDQVSRQEKELNCANSEINKLQSSLFNSMSEVDVLRGKVMTDQSINSIALL